MNSEERGTEKILRKRIKTNNNLKNNPHTLKFDCNEMKINNEPLSQINMIK